MTKKTSGIYKITNDRTGENYIGQSKNIERRIKSHENELRQGTHHNRGMQSDYLRGDTFSFKVLEETSSNRQVLNQKEEQYISQYNSFNQGYNQTPGGQYDKYKGYYGHGGGRLQSNTRYSNYNYSRQTHRSNQLQDTALTKAIEYIGFGILILLFAIILWLIVYSLIDDGTTQSLITSIIIVLILPIIMLLIIILQSILSIPDLLKKRINKREIKNDKRKFESDNIYERKIESVKNNSNGWKTCPNCKKTIRKNNLICPRCGKFIGNNNSSNSKDDEMD